MLPFVISFLCFPLDFKSFFFFNDTATTEIYTLSLHDALPISSAPELAPSQPATWVEPEPRKRSEEHTSELQSHHDLVCRLLLEKKKKKQNMIMTNKKKSNKKNKQTKHNSK